VTARGGDVSGDEEEGNEEGCQEKEVVSALSTLGAAPPSGTYTLLFSKAFVKVSLDNFLV
jgi:hypothetical protein